MQNKLALPILLMILISLPLGYGVFGFIWGMIGQGIEWPIRDFIAKSFSNLNKSALVDSSIFSIKVAVLSTLIALILCYIFIVYAFLKNQFKLISILMGAIFIIPHPTFAILLELTFSNASMLERWLTWFIVSERPILPNTTSLIHSPSGGFYILAMAIKEAPFIWFILLGVTLTHDFKNQIKVAQSLGYEEAFAIIRCILPQIYQHLKFPLYTIIIFVIGHVEMAVILAPFEPQTLGVMILTLFNETNEFSRHQAFLLGGWLIILGLFALLLFHLIIKICSDLFHFIMTHHSAIKKSYSVRYLMNGVPILNFFIGFTLVLGIIGLFILSVATYWPYPMLWPESLTLVHWKEVAILSLPLLFNTLLIAFISVLFSLIIVMFLIEITKGTKVRHYASMLLFLPLLMPMIGFLLGILILLNQLNIPPFFAVVIGHMIYMMPYFYFMLQKPLAAFDKRWLYASLSLGKTPAYSYFFVKIRLLIHPIIFTVLLGFIISFNQYLPTFLLSGGEIETLNSQALIFAQGGSKRLLAAFAIMQIALSLLILLMGGLLWKCTRKSELYSESAIG
ncbi:hypothetical protein [Thorsellia kenyensis]|uniref:ABC transmembrane type-1 domain-containing protein n=1 Tax=Thorsellia kenyensis TaxID=1549888 RepID=A0ABV6CAI1_9GAMM